MRALPALAPLDEARLVVDQLDDEQLAQAFGPWSREQATPRLAAARQALPTAGQRLVHGSPGAAEDRAAAQEALRSPGAPIRHSARWADALVIVATLVFVGAGVGIGVVQRGWADGAAADRWSIRLAVLSLTALALMPGLVISRWHLARRDRQRGRAWLVGWAAARPGQLVRGVPDLPAPPPDIPALTARLVWANGVVLVMFGVMAWWFALDSACPTGPSRPFLLGLGVALAAVGVLIIGEVGRERRRLRNELVLHSALSRTAR